MSRVETTTGEVTTTLTIPRFEVFQNAGGGGYLQFSTMVRVTLDGAVLSEAPGESYMADFATLPETFPVDVDGTIVYVSCQTILNGLDAVADAVMAGA